MIYRIDGKRKKNEKGVDLMSNYEKEKSASKGRFWEKYGVIILGVIIGLVWVAIEEDLFSFNNDSRLDPITFASYEKGYEVTAPGDWTREPEASDPGVEIVLGSPGGAAAFLIYEESKVDYALTADEYYEICVNMSVYESNELPDEDIQLVEAEPFTINGSKTKGCEFYHREDGFNSKMALHFFETDDAYVRVVALTKASAFEEYRPIFKEMAESIIIK